MPTLQDYVDEAVRRALSAYDLQRRIDDLISSRIAEIGIPHIEYDTLKVDTVGWLHVPFRRRFGSVPAVIALSDYREGKYTKPKYEAPPFPISVPPIEMKVPQIGPGLQGKLDELLGSIDAIPVPTVEEITLPEIAITVPSLALPDLVLDCGPYPEKWDMEYRTMYTEFFNEANKHYDEWAAEYNPNVPTASPLFPTYDVRQTKSWNLYRHAVYWADQYLTSRKETYWACRAQIGLIRILLFPITAMFKKVQELLELIGSKIITAVGMTKESVESLEATIGQLKTLVGSLSESIAAIKVSLNFTGDTFKATDEAFVLQGEEVTKAVNANLEALRASSEKQLKGAANYVQAELGDVFDRSIGAMYEIAGLMPGMDTAKVQIRNRSQTGFEFYAPGKMTMSWVAFGL